MTALHDLLNTRFRQNPESPAVLGATGPDISYGDLAGMISRFQEVLAEGETTAVGVLSTRSLEAYVAVLGAFFSGIKFVPMNPDLPTERLKKIADAGAVTLLACDPSTVVTASSLCVPHIDMTQCLSGPACVTLEQEPVTTGSIAYQMFTSGSTGDPKGVPISYGNLSHYVTSIIAALDIPLRSRFSQLFDLSFDLSLHDIFVSLACGGTVCPASKLDLMMPHSYLTRKKIEVWFSVPMLAAVAVRGQAAKPVGHAMRMALFCGEPLPTQYATDFGMFLQPGAPLYNLYGPTEATIAITAEKFQPGHGRFSSVPLGQPFGENHIAVELDDGRITAPLDGQDGELLLGGPQVFDGYQPVNAAECFVMADGVRYYRSGDIVRVEEGEIVHMGRTDSQIKLRGYRIELGDIEAAVRRVLGYPVVAAVVLGDAEQRLIGIAYEADQPVGDTTVLSDHLPAYMMPARWLRLDKMPVNINQKIDRKALKQMPWPD